VFIQEIVSPDLNDFMTPSYGSLVFFYCFRRLFLYKGVNSRT